MVQKRRIAIFISGRGSNMAALIRAVQKDDYPADIVCVLSDKADAKGLQTASSHGIKTYILLKENYETKYAYDAAIDQIMQDDDIHLICLAGFMRLLSDWFCDKWDKKIINIHPSLLPSFKGINTHQRALDAGVKFSGCTVHYVTAAMDEGPIIAQAVVPVLVADTPQTLAARILTCEHKLYPDVLYNLCTENNIDDPSFFEASSYE